MSFKVGDEVLLPGHKHPGRVVGFNLDGKKVVVERTGNQCMFYDAFDPEDLKLPTLSEDDAYDSFVSELNTWFKGMDIDGHIQDDIDRLFDQLVLSGLIRYEDA